jgi:hypothetical protein
MATCHDMRKGEIYVCEDCGIELQVVAECRDAGTPAEQCGCHAEGESGGFFCCNRPLKKK